MNMGKINAVETEKVNLKIRNRTRLSVTSNRSTIISIHMYEKTQLENKEHRIGRFICNKISC